MGKAMGQKRKSGENFEVPSEAKDKVKRMAEMWMFRHCSEQEIYQALEECNMDLANATTRLATQARKKRDAAGGGGEELKEGTGSTGTDGESPAFPDCPKKLTKHSRNEKWTPAPDFDKEKGRTGAGVPAEWKEQVERIKEIVKESGCKFTEEEIYEMLKQCKMDPDLAAERLLANSLEEFEEEQSKRKKKKRIVAQVSNFQHKVRSSSSSSSGSINKGGSLDDDVGRTDKTHDNTVQGIQGNSIQSIRNDSPGLSFSPFHHMTYSSMEHPATMSMKVPPYTPTPSASIRRTSQTPFQGNNLSTGHGFTHPYTQPSYYQPQLPLQRGHINQDVYMQQILGNDMTSPQQEVFQGGSSSQANADPYSWGSFLGRGSTPQQFLPDLPVIFDSSQNYLNSALHFQAQHHHGNDYRPIGLNYDFAAGNNQPNPGVMSALPEQQGGSPGLVPLPSDGNTQHHDMPLTQQEVYQWGGLSWANANASGWGSIQGTGSTPNQSPPIPPYSPALFNISGTSHDSTLQAQDHYRNNQNLLISPAPASTPLPSFSRLVPVPAHPRNQHAGEGSSLQGVNEGWHHPGMRVRPNHQQQSLDNTITGNLQDLLTRQQPRDPGP